MIPGPSQDELPSVRGSASKLTPGDTLHPLSDLGGCLAYAETLKPTSIGTAFGHGLDLSVTIIAIQIGKNSASPALQIGSHAFRNSLQLFRPPFFRRLGLRLFDPGIELKMWVSIHGFDVLGEGSHLGQRRVLRQRI